MLWRKKDQTKRKIYEVKEQLSKLAVEMGKDWDYDLNFSENSVKDVAAILNEHHLEYSKTKKEVEGFQGVALEFGLYIVKVLEKEFGEGELGQNHPEMGENTFPFTISGITTFPYVWVLKQIHNGEQDNVWTKYQVLKQELERKREK